MQVDQTAVKVDLFLRASGLLPPKYTVSPEKLADAMEKSLPEPLKPYLYP